MKIFLEEWVQDQKFNESVNRLFEEAILCYRAKAYRASLLFSFTAFQKILKYRLVNAPLPKSFENRSDDWQKIINELSNEDRVDHKITQCINQNKEANQIFVISEDLRSQYTYWKDRRNDCAHGKTNIIDINHVEAFWLFLKSNLPKFHVNGGKESLLNKFNDYFNDDITPRNANPINVINDIPNAVYEAESKEFFKEIIEIVKTSELWNLFEVLDEKQEIFLLGIFNLSTEYRNSFIEVLEENLNVFALLLEREPTLLQYINKPTLIRSLWKKHLNFNNYYKVVINMMKYDLIPETEKEELFESSLKNSKDYYFEEATEIDYQILYENGFIKYFEESAFKDRKISNFNWSERNKNLVCFFIKYSNKFDEEFVKAIDSTFLGSNHPYKLKEALKNLFYKNNAIYERLIETFDEMEFDFPDLLRID